MSRREREGARKQIVNISLCHNPAARLICFGKEAMDMPDGFVLVTQLLPERIRRAAASLPVETRGAAEELRLRCGAEPSLLLPEGEITLSQCGAVRGEDLSEVLERTTGCSLHAHADELRRGFLIARGGARVGVCGTAVIADGRVSALRALSSLCIRVPRQIRSAGEGVLPSLTGVGSVLILSPPGGGKTTFLRELVRHSAESGLRVSLADERGEVAAVWEGVPQFDVGRCTDILTGAPKAEAAILLLRAMNPQIIALDEITAREDIGAVAGVAACGVGVYATAHASKVDDLAKRPLYRELMELGVFEKAVVICGTGRGRSYEVTAL